ncbi:hypothetical protein [Streptomyces prasinopilosus]|uniref:Integral membrane protein n=1 Tax=Streptomyces prasinopilosus TaxID=67344 RepID=A0A1G6N9M2_9ACTN|nr:hypothetical protein [Streptomyces prasinopilosus]SDC63936.1 hypothetical protein SAMN05216505_1038 [Streptomyces prasinopilosus]
MTGLGELDRESARPGAGRGTADPVKALLHRHRELCERAVDPLEIAAGLEAHGVTDRTAARFKHRDVFSLAEELYARIPRDGGTPRPAATTAPGPRAGRVVLTLLPGVLGLASTAALRLTHGPSRVCAVAAGVLATALALRAALRRGGPPGTVPAPPTTGTAAWTCWLLGYALLGDGLLRTAITGGPDGPPTHGPGGDWELTVAPVLALILAFAPGAWSVRFFAVRARRKVAASRGLEDFADSVRPLLFGSLALFLGALAALLTLCATVLDESPAHHEVLTLGALLFLARLLALHGLPHAPRTVLATASLAQAAALATVFAARLPGCGALGTPVETLAAAWGPGGVAVLVCGTAALALLIHAARTLTRASAHAQPEAPPQGDST